MTRRLLLTYLTFALLIVAGLEIPLGCLQQKSEQRRALSQLEHDAEVLAVFVDADLSRHDIGHIEALAYPAAQRLGGYVDIVDSHAALLVTTRPAPAAMPSEADIRTVLRGQGRVSARTGGSAGPGMMSVAVTVHPGLAPQGAIRLSMPTAAASRRANRFWFVLAAGGLLVLALAALIAFALARWISRPVRALEQATRRLADDPTPPPPVPATTGPPELRRLAATFTATAERLHTLISSQRSFIGHASHQLKTPLAALRLRLENLEPDLAPPGGANLQAALVETDRLARMVESLLAMARYEQTTLPRERLRLSEAVTQRISFWTPLADARSIRLTADGPPDAHVTAVSGALDQILDNLLSNALRATPSGSTVTVSWHPAASGTAPSGTATSGTATSGTADPGLSRNPGAITGSDRRLGGPPPLRADARPGSPSESGAMVEIHVTDEGPGLSTEQCTQAMAPFWRAPGSPSDGTGLGLSLVRKLAEASGGAAALQPALRTGLDATVRLPADPSPAAVTAPA